MKTIWNKWECQKGNRWSSTLDVEYLDGSYCYFSGCKEKDHRITLSGSTTNLEEASKWFHSNNASTDTEGK